MAKSNDSTRRVVQGDEKPDPDRLRAAQYVIDHELGKAPEFVKHDVDVTGPRWVQAITDAIVTLPDEAENTGDIIDAEIINEDEYDWEEDPAPQQQPRGDPHDSRVEQVIEPTLPRTTPWGRGPKKASTAAERREGRA